MPVLDEGVLTRHAEAPAEARDVTRCELLVPEYQDRVLGEGIADPVERIVVEAGKIDPERFSAERLTERAQFQRSSHDPSPFNSAPSEPERYCRQLWHPPASATIRYRRSPCKQSGVISISVVPA